MAAGPSPATATIPSGDFRSIVRLERVQKFFGAIQALHDVDITIGKNETVGLIGDNGAGKSVLIKSISGAVIPDEGEIRLDGEVVHFRSPLDARAAGIETVYQDLALSPSLSIVANLFLGRELRKAGLAGKILRTLDRAEMRREARAQLSALGLQTIQDIDQTIDTLSGGQRQGVAVARAAAFGTRVIIMDEPTAALGVRETAHVLDIMRQLRDQGRGVLVVSHNLDLVFDVADRIHVLRLGRTAGVRETSKTTHAEIVHLIMGVEEATGAQA